MREGRQRGGKEGRGVRMWEVEREKQLFLAALV